MNLQRLRDELACAGQVRFLNYAATAPLLRSSAETMARVAREGVRPMGEHFTAWLGLVESTRRATAETIGARVDEITFTTNTSTALSLVAAAVRWRDGDRVLYPADEFPSNRFVWDNLRELGVLAEAIPVEPGVPLAAQLAARDLAGVRLVALSAVSYRDGRRLDVEEVCGLCRARGILTAVDGIQAVGAVPVDARAWGCDFLACGGQKWLLGPVGSGFLFITRERLPELHVPTVGWASSRHAGDHEITALEWTEGAARFEAGLPDVAAIAALGTSLELLAAANWQDVFARVAEHRARIAAEGRAHGLEQVHDGPPERCAGIVTFRVPEERLDRLGGALHQRRVIVTRRRGEIRVAAHATTSDDEVGALVEALGQALGRAPEWPVRPAPPTSASAGPPAPTHPPASAHAPWRHAIVTGASRGLGAAIAEALARRGCALTLIARDRAALDELASRLRGAHGIGVETLVLDLADPAALRTWIAGAGKALGAADLLVNNATRADASLFVEAEPRDERAAFEINVLAPMALARAVLPGMIARGHGALLNVATTGARNALPLFSTYAASKGALWAWSEALGRELHRTGVTVTTFIPPHMDTATRRQLGRRALGYYDLGTSSQAEGHRPGQADRLAGVARRALAAAQAGRALELSRRARWELALNAIAPARVAAGVRRRWKGIGRRRTGRRR